MRTPPTSRIILPYIAEIEKWLQIFLQSFSHIFLFMAREKWEESRAARDVVSQAPFPCELYISFSTSMNSFPESHPSR